MIKYKIVPNTPDNVCELCQQQIDGVCRAFSIPRSEEEEMRRSGSYGMECDKPNLKKIRREKHGILYKTE